MGWRISGSIRNSKQRGSSTVRKSFSLALILLLPLASLLVVRGRAADSIVLANVTVIDVARGIAKPGMTVVVAGNRISEVGLSGQVTPPQSARVIDANG